MPTTLAGSVWRKWDLHVHTPESFYQNYPGTKEEAWEAFLADLEALPPEFKVIGINDYVLVEGYERVLKEKREQGRLKNIDLILPVVELRLDKFGGTVSSVKTGATWSRINLHVIFDQVEAQFIREQFLSAISPHYNLIPGSSGEGKWKRTISRDSIEALGQAIIDSVPADQYNKFGNALIEGFNNLSTSAESVYKALENDALTGKHVVAVGKTEWENLKWNDHTIAEKKTLINSAHLVFTAAENVIRYKDARTKLFENGVNDRLLDCSDAHWLSTSKDKDRIGNCFTWVKADPTFLGLLQAIEEFDARIFVGESPPKRALVEANKTKFIKTVTVGKKPESNLAETWFDLKLPLNSDLVAVIGNKGSGKSAFSDVIALAGYTRNFARFSFLTPSRFRGSKGRLASQFNATLTWHDGTTTSMDLDKDPLVGSIERVKYLPQMYLEDLCNELGDRGSHTFDAELRKIIYSHVPEEDRLSQPSMDMLLDFRVTEINKARQALKQDVSKINLQILEYERRISPEFKSSLEEQLAAKKAELSAHEASKPQPVEDPNELPEALEESKAASAEIETLELFIQEIEKEDLAQRDKKSAATRREAVARKIQQALINFGKQRDTFISELKSLIEELNIELPVESLLRVEIDINPAESIAKDAQAQIVEIEAAIQSYAPGSIHQRRKEAIAAIATAKSKLDERQQQFVRYKEELASWERRKVEVNGSADRPGTIVWLAIEIASLSDVPAQLAALKTKRAQLASEIHGQICAMVNEYKRLYGPVQAFVAAAQQMDMELPLVFSVRIEDIGFEDQFLGRLNRQVKGSFSGVDESIQRLRSMLSDIDFDSSAEAVAFATHIDELLHVDRRDGQVERETRLADQLRKGVDPLEVLDYIFGLEYLNPRYSLTYAGQEIGQLSPGERGLLLLVFYLLVDKDDIPIIIDQPEENLDNQTIYKVLVKCIKQAKDRRQVIMVTHNPNLAVVCDAEQIVYASCDKTASKFDYEAGAIEQPDINDRVVQILEGTKPAFKNRQAKYRML
ncbi:TrlF family AAA-like ATPase [Xanthomonas sp. 1678]|uniref:TrlF family AAA-like ATPase n=1 Tax=Xanthomonas sp. 1678 TaxID=3158788 RepID=UPI0028655C6D|nr:putative ATPase [Xanthomonas translucens]